MSRKVQPADLANRVTLGVAEVALVLGVSENLVRESLHELPHFHMKSRVLIPVDGLRRWASDRVQEEESESNRIAESISSAIVR